VAVVDAVAVAEIKAIGGAKAPDGVLDEPGKVLRVLRVELACINVPRGDTQNICAIT
jgi:hypothetical protein